MKSISVLPIILLAAASQTYAHDVQSETFSKTINIAHNDTEKNQQDAIQIILIQHKYIKDQFSKLDKLLDKDVDQSRSLFKDLKDFLVKHETMEETEWYPELEKNEKFKEIIAMLIKEEKSAADAIKDIDSTKDNKEWVAKVRKLKKAVEAHASDEENKLFPKVKQAVDKKELQELGKKLESYSKSNNMKY